MSTAYPLAWPMGWKRTDFRRSTTAFKNNTFSRARDHLGHELELLGATDIILSTNVPLRFDGQPRGDYRDYLTDPGVAVYFMLRKRPMVLARDAYDRVSDNLRSLGLAIEHLRGLERHGGAVMVERAFTGFAALPAPMAMGPTCWQILGIDPDSTWNEGDTVEIKTLVIEGVFREKAKQLHPDLQGGDTSKMAQLNAARDEALREVGAA